MTREERLELLKQIEKDIYVCSIESTLLDDAKSCAIHSAIEELEQEPVLGKIREEIAEIQLIGYATVDGKREIASRAVLQIIDKYKAESEV
jgi:hypothetical protein